MILRTASLLLVLAASVSACVDTDVPQTGAAREALAQPYCLEPVSALKPAPEPAAHLLPLPPDTLEQTWLMVADEAGPNDEQTYSLYQVSVKTRTVTWWTRIKESQKPLALLLMGRRPGTQVSIRNPPPPPPPDGDGWGIANRAVAIAAHIEATQSIVWQ